MTAVVATWPGEDGQPEVHFEVRPAACMHGLDVCACRSPAPALRCWCMPVARGITLFLQPSSFSGHRSLATAAPHPTPMPQVFQVSAQCVRLWKEGWFQQQQEPGGTSTLRNPKARAGGGWGAGGGCWHGACAWQLLATRGAKPEYVQRLQPASMCNLLPLERAPPPLPGSHRPPCLPRLCRKQEPKDATPVIVAGKDQGEVDNDYFLVRRRLFFIVFFGGIQLLSCGQLGTRVDNAYFLVWVPLLVC